MKRIRALLRTTWWLWLILFGGLGVLSAFEKAALICVPLCVFVFFYFAFVRFDEHGHRR